MSRLAALLLLLAAAAGARNREEAAECPRGQHRELTDDPYQPMKCVNDRPKGSRLSDVAGPQGFKFRPKCPHGTRPAENPGGLQPYRCVPVTAGEAAPELKPLKGEAAGQEEPVEAPEPERAAVRRAPKVYRRYTVPGELSFEYPAGFQAADAWKDEIPLLTFTLDDGTPGKPLTFSLTRAEKGQPGYLDMEAAITKEKDWQGAQDAGASTVAGRKARLTSLEGETMSAYIPLHGDGYYTLTYSAPADAFTLYKPAFDRALKSLKLLGRLR